MQFIIESRRYDTSTMIRLTDDYPGASGIHIFGIWKMPDNKILVAKWGSHANYYCGGCMGIEARVENVEYLGKLFRDFPGLEHKLLRAE